MKSAANQLRSISHCSSMQSSTEFVAQKIVTSSANNRHLERLITLQRSLMNMFKSKGRRTDPCGAPGRSSKGKEKLRREDCRLER
jgi:hypothetical protein